MVRDPFNDSGDIPTDARPLGQIPQVVYLATIERKRADPDKGLIGQRDRVGYLGQPDMRCGGRRG